MISLLLSNCLFLPIFSWTNQAHPAPNQSTTVVLVKATSDLHITECTGHCSGFNLLNQIEVLEWWSLHPPGVPHFEHPALRRAQSPDFHHSLSSWSVYSLLLWPHNSRKAQCLNLTLFPVRSILTLIFSKIFSLKLCRFKNLKSQSTSFLYTHPSP